MHRLAVYLFLTIISNRSVASQNNMAVITRFVSDFIGVISSNKFNSLNNIADIEPKDFPEIIRFLNGNHFLPNQKESLAKIISSSTSVVITPVYYQNNLYRKFGYGYTVFFSKSNEISSVLDRKKSWLVDYAACDFFIKNGRVNFGLTFCYNETEGPFFIQYK